MTAMSEEEAGWAAQMRTVLYGHLVSRAVCAFVELGLPPLLADGSAPLAALADRTGTHRGALLRLLRVLAAYGVVAEPESHCFALTGLGRTLLADTPGSALPTAQLVAEEVGAAWMRLTETVRSGKPSFDRVFGFPFFEYLERQPRTRGVFDRSQAAGLDLEAAGVLAALDLSGVRTVVDVGGGDGALLLSLLERHPGISGVVFDLPGTAEHARARLRRSPAAARCRVEEGDFFRSVPGGGDAYLLSHVLHDWADDDAAAILRTCVRDIPRHARVHVVDLLVGPSGAGEGADQRAALMDLYMLSLFGGDGGRERSEAEFTRLLLSAGLRVVDVRRLPDGLGVITAVPAADGLG